MSALDGRAELGEGDSGMGCQLHIGDLIAEEGIGLDVGLEVTS